jgi:uncharacterized coiled-coil protein SlyX
MGSEFWYLSNNKRNTSSLDITQRRSAMATRALRVIIIVVLVSLPALSGGDVLVMCHNYGQAGCQNYPNGQAYVDAASQSQLDTRTNAMQAKEAADITALQTSLSDSITALNKNLQTVSNQLDALTQRVTALEASVNHPASPHP